MQKAGVSFHKYSLRKCQIQMACPFSSLTAPASPSSISSLLDVNMMSGDTATILQLEYKKPLTQEWWSGKKKKKKNGGAGT